MSGRARYKTHGGIPQGSTNNLGGNLDFYLQWKQGVAVGQWDDQSANANHATQSTSGDQAALAEGGLDFEFSEADHYDFGSEVDIAAEEAFTVWIVSKHESNSGNACVLSLNNTNHLLEFFNGGNKIRTRLGAATTNIVPGGGSDGDFPTGEKFLLTVEREAGGTGNLVLYKNGVLLPQNSQSANPGDAEFVALGARNADRYFDGIMYDVACARPGSTSPAHTERINAYLCAKHGISQTL